MDNGVTLYVASCVIISAKGSLKHEPTTVYIGRYLPSKARRNTIFQTSKSLASESSPSSQISGVVLEERKSRIHL